MGNIWSNWLTPILTNMRLKRRRSARSSGGIAIRKWFKRRMRYLHRLRLPRLNEGRCTQGRMTLELGN